MSKVVSVLIVTVLIAGIAAFVFHDTSVSEASALNAPKSIYDFKMKDIDGKNINLKSYKGKVLLVVNTASKCGYTPQFDGLEKTYQKYKGQGFTVLGFPANNFKGQDPGTNQEIKEFCTLKYGVSFPMFSKISVKGEDQHPLYAYLTDPKTDPKFAGEITWNFNKFLIDRKGNIVARFTSKDTPESEVVAQAIEKYLKDN